MTVRSAGEHQTPQDETLDPHTIKLARADHIIHDLLSARWSPRGYSSAPVEQEKLQRLFEAARWTASSGNGQPWSFIVATQDDPAFQEMAACLAEGNVPWASKAPVLVIGVTATVRANGKPNRHGYYDLGQAVQSLSLQATELGLFVHQMGGFSPDEARTRFAIPDDHDPVVMFTIGYRGSLDGLSDRHREQETSPRTRKPLAEFVFAGRWGDTAPLAE